MIEHLLRHDSLTKIVIGDVEGHIRRGRPKKKNMKQIMINMGKSNYKLKKLNYNKEG